MQPGIPYLLPADKLRLEAEMLERHSQRRQSRQQQNSSTHPAKAAQHKPPAEVPSKFRQAIDDAL